MKLVGKICGTMATLLLLLNSGWAADARRSDPDQKPSTLRSPADQSRSATVRADQQAPPREPVSLDLREPMALAARAIPPRLDPAMDYRPFFMLRGEGGIPRRREHASWDLGDMTGRCLEGLLLARRMGITEPELSRAEQRLARFLFKLLGEDGLVHEPQSGAVDHTFSQGSAMFGLLALYEDSGDPVVRRALERLITAQLKAARRDGDQVIDTTVKLPESSGSHLAGYQIYPAMRFYELTGYADALTLAEGLARWALADPVLGPGGEITKALSWEGHIHSWFETLAGCLRVARGSELLNRSEVVERCRAIYEWVKRTNGTSFGWLATYPTGGSCETCAISSAIRLALELAAAGYPEYLDDVERFVRNQVIEAQFTDLAPFSQGTNRPSLLMLGTFDSQSMPNCHLGTRGGEDVGTLEGCCLNGGMRALSLAWENSQTVDEKAISVHLGLTRSGPAGDVIGYQPFAGRVDVIPRHTTCVRVRLPSWVDTEKVSVSVEGNKERWRLDQGYACLESVPAGSRVSVQFPLREMTERVVAGGQNFTVTWKGDVVVGVEPPGKNEAFYAGREMGGRSSIAQVPDTWFVQDAAGLAALSILARMDLEREGQPFFRIYPFAEPPRAEHEKWDDGDMTGRYVEALIQARRLTGADMDARERLLREYLLKLFDLADGLCYTRGTAWTPRRACLFSQSCAMMGLLAWHRETGSLEPRKLLDWQVEGLMRLAERRDGSALFPKYEFDGTAFVNEPKDKDAPPWYGGRLIWPLVEYWQLSGRDDVRDFISELVRYVTEVSPFIKRDGEVERGEGWWGHLHGTMDMTAGVAEFGRLTQRPELVDWAKRVYEWIGRTHTTRYGWVADVSGGRIGESCGIAARFRLGLALYRAGVVDPFGEMDRHLRNHLLECQFTDLSFLEEMQPYRQRTRRAVYGGVDAMIRGTFQCWGTANDLIGHDDIEGCGAGGGVQGLALAAASQAEWKEDKPGEAELRVHLLFNALLRSKPQPPFTSAAPVAAELWSYLPQEGKVLLRAHEAIPRLALRLPDGAELSGARIRRTLPGASEAGEELFAPLRSGYMVATQVQAGEQLEFTFTLREYATTEIAAGVKYRVQWKGSSVMALSPPGTRVPLYANRQWLKSGEAAMAGRRYP